MLNKDLLLLLLLLLLSVNNTVSMATDLIAFKNFENPPKLPVNTEKTK